MGWQINDMKNVKQGISSGLQYYFNKYGKPPTVLLEVSDQLTDAPLPEGLNFVIKAVRIPKNTLLIGETNEVPQNQKDDVSD